MSESNPILEPNLISESNPFLELDADSISGLGGQIDLKGAMELVAASDFDELVYKSCSVISNSMDSVKYDTVYEPVTISSNYQDLAQIPQSVKCSHPIPEGNPLPQTQPGAGIYTSPLTLNVVKNIDDLVKEIHQVLHKLQMPNYYDSTRFKWSIATYFTSGFARFSIRIWFRKISGNSGKSSNSNNYAVEVMRERGDRILVTRGFEFLSNVITGQIAIEDLVFSPDMFDWAPKKLPDEILATLPKPSEEAIKSGIDSMVSLVATPYDDVCINGCATVAKLCSTNVSTKDNLATSQALIEVLIQVVFGSYSLDTRTLAAMALSVLTESTSFHFESVTKENFTRLEKMTDKELLAELLGVKSHEVHYLAYYSTQTISNIRTRLG
jgi:hypothetical protein